MSKMSGAGVTINWTDDFKNSEYDGLVLVAQNDSLPSELNDLGKPLQDHRSVDSGLLQEVIVLRVPDIPGNRLVFAPTGPLNRDYDDVRRFSDAAYNGMQRALKAGMMKPLLVCPPHEDYENCTTVAALGALQALYLPLEVRNENPKPEARGHKASTFGLWVSQSSKGEDLKKTVEALESGRLVCRDIGGSDPEFMAAPRVATYVEDCFQNTNVKVNVISDLTTLKDNYPCLAAVNRCAHEVVRHQARIIELEYPKTVDSEEEDPKHTLMLVGKGITYDTGGADIKAGGVMAGMHRDKCGAAAVAGFFMILAKLQPKNLRVIGAMAMVRNSVGADCYVADELLKTKAGPKVRVGNTDAEGRLVMVDLLCEMKEKAKTTNKAWVDEPKGAKPTFELVTIATLTGHAIRAVGPNYSIIMDNGPAHKKKTATEWQEAGEKFGDMFEVSTIRREDYESHRGKSIYEDILQANNLPSSATPRGHQSPAAFLIMASGLDKHGVDAELSLPYSHVDIAGSSGPFPGVPTGAPIVAMAAKYILPNLS